MNWLAAVIVLIVCAVMALVRLGIGPTIPDRVVGFDTINTIVVVAMVLLGATTIYIAVVVMLAAATVVGCSGTDDEDAKQSEAFRCVDGESYEIGFEEPSALDVSAGHPAL